MDAITYPCPNLTQPLLSKGVLDINIDIIVIINASVFQEHSLLGNCCFACALGCALSRKCQHFI